MTRWFRFACGAALVAACHSTTPPSPSSGEERAAGDASIRDDAPTSDGTTHASPSASPPAIVAPAVAQDRAPPPPEELPRVVNPWDWPRARGAGDHERAIEDIGPYEPLDRGDPTSPVVNTNAHYWTARVGLAWTRDVDLDFDDEPVDLDGDGTPDTHLTRHIHARGGILANPRLFGLTPTLDDPRGRIGRVSVSTGVLGAREALRPDGTPSGEVGMTCWICHGSHDPATGHVVPGLAGVDFDYGLVLATSALLDEHDAAAVAYRREHGLRPGRQVQARLLLAGPGRQDLIDEFGFDVTVPRTCAAFYPKVTRARPKAHGAFNPLSVPAVLAVGGLDLQNWIGSENANVPALERLLTLAGAPEHQVLAELGLASTDRAASRRALLTDLRNLSTLALQQDSYPGLMWADAVYGHPDLSPAAIVGIPPMYAARSLRAQIARSAAAVEPRVAHRGPEAARIVRGRAIFSERIVGEIANREILPQAPSAYADDHLRGPILAPLDPTAPLTARLPVRCADCHSAAPLANRVPLATHPPPFGRCTHCHRIHPPDDDSDGDAPETARAVGPLGQAREHDGDPFVPIRALGIHETPAAEVAACERCHHQHRDFGPLVYSSSRILPFDADGDGLAQGDEADDAAAGGIGTEPLLQIETPASEPPRPHHLPLIHWRRAHGPVAIVPMGIPWVRIPPLTAVALTAPYLHNGSVPSLEALLEPVARRPVTFPLGHTGFVFDTRLRGNRNIGHEFGSHLSDGEKKDLLAFLRSL